MSASIPCGFYSQSRWAYMLYSKSGGTQDPYNMAVIDTMVGEIQIVPGDDRCVLLLGYKEQMEDMFKVSVCDAHE
jgi:hypothetical protein